MVGVQDRTRAAQLHPTHQEQPLPGYPQGQPLRLHPDPAAAAPREQAQAQVQLQEVQVPQALLRLLQQLALLQQGVRVRQLRQRRDERQAPHHPPRGDEQQARGRGQGLQVHQIQLPEEVL